MFNSGESNPRVSVRIPAHNHEKYVAECLRSVLDQTFTDLEVVITDDGSTDHTVDIIRSFDDPRLKLVTFQQNEGCNVAIADCGRRAMGEYIANLCSDDVWELNKLEKQVHFLDEHPNIDAVFTKVRLIDEDGDDFLDDSHPYTGVFDVENRTRDQWLRKFFLEGNCLCAPSVLIRASVYRELDLQDCRMASLGDFDLWIRFCLDHDLHIIDERLTRFRIRADEANASGNRIDNHTRIYFEYKQIMDRFLAIDSTQRLLSIFPECSRYGPVLSDAIPYLLGRRAIDTPERFRQLWGLETIYDFMADETAVDLLRDKFDFRYRDLHRMASSIDAFAIRECSQEREHIQKLEEERHNEARMLSELHTQLSEKESAWNQVVAGYELELANYQSEVNSLAKHYSEVQEKYESAKSEASEAADEIERMKATFSWKLTRPLRWVRTAMRNPSANHE